MQQMEHNGDVLKELCALSRLWRHLLLPGAISQALVSGRRRWGGKEGHSSGVWLNMASFM